MTLRSLGPLAAALAVVAGLAGCGGGGEEQTPAAGSGSGSPGTSTVETATSSAVLPEWEQYGTIETPRDDFGTSVVGRSIWIMGGMTGERGNRLTSIEVMDTRTGEWTTSDIEVPIGLASFETAAVGPRIYLFGGLDKNAKATDWAGVLDTRTGRWRRLPPLPNARYAHTVTLHRGKIYVVGGENNKAQQVAAIDVFDPRTETWSTAKTPMPGARNSHDTLSTPQGLMVVGGFDADGPSKRVDLFDPETGRTREVPDLPRTISRGGGAVADGKVWFSWHEYSYVLDLADPTRWQEANPMTLARHGQGFVPVGGWIYNIAGCSASPLRDVRTVDRLPLG